MAETRENEAFYFQWHITERCNNNCKHCYSRGKRLADETSLEGFQAILDDITSLCKRWGRKIHISLVGGDPLLHDDFLRFIQILKETTDVRTSVAGNPEKLTPDLMSWLKERIFAYQLSVDGVKETHDWIRYPGSYERTLSCIRVARKGGLRTHVMTTVSKRNVGQLIAIMDAVYEAGATHWTFGRYVPPVGQTDDIVDPKEFREVLEAVEQAHRQYEGEHYRLSKEPLLFPLRNCDNLPDWEENPKHCQVEGCGIGTLALTILPNNTIMACRRHSGSVLGKWEKKGDLLKIFLNSPRMKEFREVEKIQRCGKCAFLYHCRGCRAVGYAMRGNLLDPDPSCAFFQPEEGNL